jgi:hypothetical protein
MNFATAPAVDITGSPKVNWDVLKSSQPQIKFGVELEFRSWGIKGYTLTIPTQDCIVTVTLLSPTNGEHTTVDVHLDVYHLRRATDPTNTLQGMVMLTNLELVFTDKGQVNYSESCLYHT